MPVALLGAALSLWLGLRAPTRHSHSRPDPGPAGELCVRPIEVGELTPAGSAFGVRVDKRAVVIVDTNRGGWIGGLELGKPHHVRILAGHKVLESFTLLLDPEHPKRQLYRSGLYRTWRLVETPRKCPWAPGQSGAREPEP
jgi:hypothetical protein